MKKATLLIAILLTQGCSKEPAAPGRGNTTYRRTDTKSALTILAFSSQHEEAAVLGAASSIIAAGVSLPATSAELCWAKERKRPAVAMSCLLAWSIGEDRSAALERIIAEQAVSNRQAALAAIRAEHPLAQLGIAEIQQLLQQLPQDPVWLKAKAYITWQRTHPSPGISEAEQLARLLLATRPTLPTDYRLSYEALTSLKPAAAAAMIEQHCGPTLTEEFQVRCWRFLSAFAEGQNGVRLPAQMRAKIPARDRAWQQFQAEMPGRARLLLPYLNQ